MFSQSFIEELNEKINELDLFDSFNKNDRKIKQLEEFRVIICRTLIKTESSQAFLADFLDIPKTTINRILNCNKKHRTRVYDFNVALKLSVMAADNYEFFLDLMIKSGNPHTIEASHDENVLFAALKAIYQIRTDNWRERVEALFEIAEKQNISLSTSN